LRREWSFTQQRLLLSVTLELWDALELVHEEVVIKERRCLTERLFMVSALRRAASRASASPGGATFDVRPKSSENQGRKQGSFEVPSAKRQGGRVESRRGEPLR